MSLKSGTNQKKDILYVVAAVVLTLLLAVYIIWVANGLGNRASDAFSTEPTDQVIPTFDFGRYDKIMQKISFPTGATSTASSTASSTKR